MPDRTSSEKQTHPVTARPEARPLTQQELSFEQKAAARQACRLLAHLAGQKTPAKPPRTNAFADRFLPPIDAERHNQILLLDGARGSGKTALLLTLIDSFSRQVRGDVDEERTIAALLEREEREETENLTDEVLKNIKAVVPVGLVDLQPLPHTANLWLHLAGPLQRVVEAIEEAFTSGPDHANRLAPWHAETADEPKCARAWRGFLQAVALGWDADLNGRRANLDPEAFALELEQSGRKRIDTVTTFRMLMDALVDEYGSLHLSPHTHAPLFVISVDDADMNPARAAEILQALRSLYHPRLVWLLTGDSGLFRAALRIQVRKEAGGSIRDANRETLIPELADAIYRKIIPPGHRCLVPALSVSERLATLKTELESLSVPATMFDDKVKNLYQYFLCNSQAAEALPDLMRNVVILSGWLRMLHFGSSADGDAALRAVAMISAVACHNDELDAFRRFNEKSMDRLLVEIAGEARQRAWQQSSKNYSRAVDAGSLDILRVNRWESSLPESRDSSAAVAGYMLAYDFAMPLLAEESAMLLIDFSMGGGLIKNDFVAGSLEGEIRWPFPELRSFWEYADMMQSWPEQGSGKFYGSWDFAQRLCWIIIKSVLRKGQFETANPDPTTIVQAILPNYELEKLLQLALICAPEYGLPSVFANKFLLALSREWTPDSAKIQRRLRELRGEGLARLIESDLGFLSNNELDEEPVSRHRLVDDASPQYQWGAVVEEERVERVLQVVESDPGRFLESLSRINHPQRDNLAYYFSRAPKRLKRLRCVEQDLLSKVQDIVRRFEGTTGTSGMAVRNVWDSIAPAPSRDLIRWTDGQFVFAWTGRPFYSLIPGKEPLVLHLPKGDFSVVSVELEVDHLDADSLSTEPMVEVIASVIVDYSGDLLAARSSVGSGIGSPWWTGIKFEVVEKSDIYWPAPRWSAGIEWLLLIDEWTKLVVQVEQIVLTAYRYDQQRLVDGIALYYLEMASDLIEYGRIFGINASDSSRKFVLPEDNSGALQGNWKSVVSRVVGLAFLGRVRSLFSTTAKLWASAVLLLATPEAGLRVESARLVLSVFKLEYQSMKHVISKRFGEVDGEGDLPNPWAEAHRLRRDPARFAASLSQEEVDATLSKIDEGNRDHPWVTDFNEADFGAFRKPE